MGQLLLFFLYNICSIFSYIGGVPVTNPFSVLFIDKCILAFQQIVTHEEYSWYAFSYVASQALET